MKLVIDRSRWGRGDGNGLLHSSFSGKMCCLGFFGKACGVPDSLLNDVGSPHDAIGHNGESQWPEWMVEVDHSFDDGEDGHVSQKAIAEDLIDVNDNQYIEDYDREQRIAALFAKHGVEVEFVDGPVSS